MIKLIKTNNSKGVKNLQSLTTKPRENWDAQIQAVQARYAKQTDEGLLSQELNHNDDIENWQW